MLWRRLLAIGMVVFAAHAGAAGESEAQLSPPGSQPRGYGYDTVSLTLPRGEPQPGRQAFLDLRCNACHQVAGEAEFPAPTSGNPGPTLGPAIAAQTAGAIATSIVAPSHSMSLATSAQVRAQVEGVLSPMGDFSGAMTVRQLLDLVAFLGSLN